MNITVHFKPHVRLYELPLGWFPDDHRYQVEEREDGSIAALRVWPADPDPVAATIRHNARLLFADVFAAGFQPHHRTRRAHFPEAKFRPFSETPEQSPKGSGRD